jgi:hypothetical protein
MKYIYYFTIFSLALLVLPAFALACGDHDHEEELGSITVCKVVIDQDEVVVDGSEFPATTFTISGFTPNPETSAGEPVGEFGIAQFSTPLSFNTALFGSSEDNTQCIAFNDLELGGYYYSEEEISQEGWFEPLYNDQFSVSVDSSGDFFVYSGELFDTNGSNDDERNQNADGHIVLNSGRPNRTLIVLNKHEVVPEPVFQCSDGIDNDDDDLVDLDDPGCENSEDDDEFNESEPPVFQCSDGIDNDDDDLVDLDDPDCENAEDNDESDEPSPENHPPVWLGPDVATTTVSELLEFSATVSDEDGDELEISFTIPGGAVYNTASGTFSWLPDATGSFIAEFVASDGLSTSTHEVLIEVIEAEDNGNGDNGNGGNGGGGGSGNLPPYFVDFTPSTSATSDESYSYDAEAQDPEADQLTFSLIEAPDGMEIATDTGVITWMPTNEQATDTPYNVIVAVADPSHVTSENFSIVVSLAGENGGDGSGGPTVEIEVRGGGGGGGPISPPSGGGSNLPPYFVDFNPPSSVTFGSGYLYPVNAFDPEGDVLTFSLVSAPEGMIIVPTTGLIDWVPTVDQVNTGPYLVTVQVSDGLHNVSESFSVSVNNPAINPALSPVGTSEVPVPITEVIEEEIEGIVNVVEEGIPIPSLSIEETTTAGGRPLLAALLAGLFNFTNGLVDWFRGNCCLINFLLWLITIIILISYIIWNNKRQKEENSRPNVIS